MSQTMNKKSSVKKPKKSTVQLVDENPEEELSGAEKIFESVKPHLTTIGLVIVACLLGFASIAFIIRSNFDKKAIEWRELSNSAAISLQTGDISGLKSVVTTYPDSKAGLWAAQMAGDQQLRRGIEQFNFDREAGKQLVVKAKENFQLVLDAPQALKTTMLDRRSHFALAYAHESLGEFAEAKKIYDKLIAEAPDSAFADSARRGSERSSNDQFAALYEKFSTFEESVIGDAPPASIPDRPELSFPETNLTPGQKPPMNDGTTDATEGSSSTDAPATTEEPAATAAETPEATAAVEPETDTPPKPAKKDE